MANSITKIYKNGVEYDIYASGGASVNTASATTAGVVKLGSDTVQTQAANNPSSTSGKTYPIQVNNGGQEVVNVPWTDHTYTSSSFDIKDLTDSTGLRTTWSGKQDALVSGTNIKTVNNNSLLGSGNIAISGGHDYSWNTLTGTSFTLSGINYRNLISTSSDTTVSVGTGLTPGMEYIIRITNSDSDNDHTMTFNSVAYIIPKSGTVTYKWLALTATTVEFEGPRYVYSMPATPEEGFIYYVLPEPEHPRTPGANTIVYFPLTDDLKDYTGTYTLTAYNSASIGTVDGVKCLNCSPSNSYTSTTISTLPQGTQARTIMFWVRYNALGQYPAYQYGTNGTGKGDTVFSNNQDGTYGIARSQYGSVLVTQENPTTGQRYHIAITIDGSTKQKIYMNGVYKNESSHTVNTQGTTLYLGRNNWDNKYLNGYLGSFIVENKVRTADEIAAYYNQTKANYGL